MQESFRVNPDWVVFRSLFSFETRKNTAKNKLVKNVKKILGLMRRSCSSLYRQARERRERERDLNIDAL